MTATTTLARRRRHGGAGTPLAKNDEPESLTRRARKLYHDIRHGSFTCCGKEWHSARYLNAHHAAAHMGRWSGKQARAAGRKMGKGADESRRWALGVLESAGLRAWKTVPVRDKDGKPVERNGRPVTREIPVRTDRARSRPEARGTVTRGTLRELHRHDRDHEKAGGHDRKAQRHRAAGRDARADAREAWAAALRGRWAGQPPRPAPDDSRVRDLLDQAAGRTNGTRPAPSRTPR